VAITNAQRAQAEQAIQDVEAKRVRLARLTAAVTEYVNGGAMDKELQELLRSYLSDKLQARLDAYAAGIAADVATIKQYISDYE
jgi:predicted metal-dependent hydrolase